MDLQRLREENWKCGGVTTNMNVAIENIFDFLMNMLSTVIQLVAYIPNQIIINLLPSLTTKIEELTTNINTIFDSITWSLSVVPPVVIITLLFILKIEISRHMIYISTHVFVKVWELIKKIKFW